MTIQQVFEAVGEFAAGKITEQELHELEEAASPGAGACGGQFTANTMAMAFEALGISPAGSAMVPAEDGRKLEVAARLRRTRDGRAAPRASARARSSPSRRSRTRSRRSPPAAARPTACCTCSRSRSEMGVPLEIDEFEAISERTPLLCDLQPGGQYVATELYEAGGVPLVLARLQEAGILNADAQHGHRQDDRRARRRGASRPRASASCARSATRSKRPAASRSCAATSRPTAAWSSSPGTSGASTPVPRACSTARRPRWRPCSPTRSRRATWS